YPVTILYEQAGGQDSRGIEALALGQIGRLDTEHHHVERRLASLDSDSNNDSGSTTSIILHLELKSLKNL
ncbi:17233_t:CDS:2, partial [Acaulospora colombiana]